MRINFSSVIKPNQELMLLYAFLQFRDTLNISLAVLLYVSHRFLEIVLQYFIMHTQMTGQDAEEAIEALGMTKKGYSFQLYFI